MALVETEIGGGCAPDAAEVRRKRGRAVERGLVVPGLKQAEAHYGAERVARPHRVDEVGDRRRRRFEDALPADHGQRALGAASDDDAFDVVLAGEAERGVPAILEAVGGHGGELGELRVVELHPAAGRETPVEHVARPPGVAEVDIDDGRRIDLVTQLAQRGAAFVGAEGERAVVEKAGRLRGDGLDSGLRLDEVPGLTRRDLEAVFAIDDGGRDAARRLPGLRLHALGEEVPARHSLEDLGAFQVVAHRADDERVGVEAS